MQHLKIQLMTSRSLYVFSVGFELFENWLEMKTEFPFQKVDLRAVLKNQLKSKRWWNWFPCNVSFCSSSLPLPNLYLSSEESTPAIRQKTYIQMEIMLGHAVLTYTHTHSGQQMLYWFTIALNAYVRIMLWRKMKSLYLHDMTRQHIYRHIFNNDIFAGQSWK